MLVTEAGFKSLSSLTRPVLPDQVPIDFNVMCCQVIVYTCTLKDEGVIHEVNFLIIYFHMGVSLKYLIC